MWYLCKDVLLGVRGLPCVVISTTIGQNISSDCHCKLQAGTWLLTGDALHDDGAGYKRFAEWQCLLVVCC